MCIKFILGPGQVVALSMPIQQTLDQLRDIKVWQRRRAPAPVARPGGHQPTRLAEQRYDWIKRGVSGEHVLQPVDGLSAGAIHLTTSTTLHQHGPCAWEQVPRWRHGRKAVLA